MFAIPFLNIIPFLETSAFTTLFAQWDWAGGPLFPHLLGASLLRMQIWSALPLIVAISVVYGATRDERLPVILLHSFRAACWMIGFMTMIFVALFFTSLML